MLYEDSISICGLFCLERAPLLRLAQSTKTAPPPGRWPPRAAARAAALGPVRQADKPALHLGMGRQCQRGPPAGETAKESQKAEA